MALTTEDMNAIRAQWEEWVADPTFQLEIEVRGFAYGEYVPQEEAERLARKPVPMARISASDRYVQMEIRKLAVAFAESFEPERLLFSERVPYDARALRACVAAYARKIADWQEEQAAKPE